MLFVCHIPSTIIKAECPNDGNFKDKFCGNEDKFKNSDYKMFMCPLTIFKHEFCVAWNDCLQHLERSLFISYKDGDIRSPSFYHHIVVPLEKSFDEIGYKIMSCPASDKYEESKCVGFHSEIVPEGSHDDVEYIPHPPEIRNQVTAQTHVNVEKDAVVSSGIKDLHIDNKMPQKSILRPGRLYV